MMRKAALAMTMLCLAGCQRGEEAASNATRQADTPVTPRLPTGASPQAAPTAPALGQTMQTNGELRLEVTEAVRAGGVLTVKTRFTLVAGSAGKRSLPPGAGSEVYLTAADKKYMLLKDDHGDAIMASDTLPDFPRTGSIRTWWGKFPAPATEVKAVNFYFDGFEPVENVAITDH